jgi:hypothetical protein
MVKNQPQSLSLHNNNTDLNNLNKQKLNKVTIKPQNPSLVRRQ